MSAFGILAGWWSFAVSAQAGALPPDLSLVAIPGTYSGPVAVRAPHDGSGRLFIVEHGGTIRIVKNGSLLPTPFLSVAVSTSGESGLLGLAFHPNYGRTGLPHSDEFYVAYTRPGGDPRLGALPDQAIARYTVSADPDLANPAGTLVLRVPDVADNHNGGDLQFGPDGYLYYSMGDGGPQNDPHGFAECLWKKPVDFNVASCGSNASGTPYFLLGKILRLDVDTRGATPGAEMCGSTGIDPAEYSIPPDNPHVGTTNTCDEIWAHGLRNPWRFSFDRATGDLLIGDVGQGAYEEVDREPAGSPGGIDYGWGRCEGRHYASVAGSGTTCPETTATVAPVIEYGHASGCAVTGGYVFRGPVAKLRGTYFYSDSCSGRLWYATASGSVWDAGGLLDTNLSSASIYGFGEDEAGNLYLARANGSVWRITSDSIFGDGFDG